MTMRSSSPNCFPPSLETRNRNRLKLLHRLCTQEIVSLLKRRLTKNLPKNKTPFSHSRVRRWSYKHEHYLVFFTYTCTQMNTHTHIQTPYPECLRYRFVICELKNGQKHIYNIFFIQIMDTADQIMGMVEADKVHVESVKVYEIQNIHFLSLTYTNPAPPISPSLPPSHTTQAHPQKHLCIWHL